MSLKNINLLILLKNVLLLKCLLPKRSLPLCPLPKRLDIPVGTAQ